MPSHPRGIFKNKYYCVIEKKVEDENWLVRKCPFSLSDGLIGV
jgi:hypothetical protein